MKKIVEEMFANCRDFLDGEKSEEDFWKQQMEHERTIASYHKQGKLPFTKPKEEMKAVESRRFTLDEAIERLEKPLHKAAFQLEMVQDDYLFEDTLLMKVALPRLFWKIVYGCAKSADIEVKEVIEEFLCDSCFRLFRSMKR